jgi:hypothetical protein
MSVFEVLCAQKQQDCNINEMTASQSMDMVVLGASLIFCCFKLLVLGTFSGVVLTSFTLLQKFNLKSMHAKGDGGCSERSKPECCDMFISELKN